METIGQRISEIRKSKRLTQEEVADLAKINLRTLQRIEKDHCEPRGNTLKQLCEVLSVSIDELIDYGKTEDRNFLIYFHLSTPIGTIIPLGQIIIPMILWLTKRDKIVGLNEQGINLLNFQIQWIVISYLPIIYAITFSRGSTMLIMFSMALLFLGIVVFPVIIAIRIHKGKAIKPFYPVLLRIIR